MNFSEIIKLSFMGATIGCFIIAIVEILIAYSIGWTNFTLNGYEILVNTIGAIIVGQGFALPSIIYEKENIPLIYQVIFQMGIGFIILLIVGVYLNWIPVTMGILPIITWIIIALIFAFLFWAGIYLYYRNEAQKINNQIKKYK
ncbi:DUF3021 domain-containing protein [Methanobrevibacter sp. DSM 116169]|uniref:DUF3021 domain-containing protein n=1 Tax=Methanobrevibacter sp. DSM 116169 TaxID=3242727 RepID=UPI0038FCE437